MSQRHTLSVLVPNYNHSRYLESYIGQMFEQSRPADEVIVVDDASTDNSVEIIQKLARRDHRIRWFRNERNLGVVGSLNRALHEATGEYIYGGAPDDGVLPGAFEKSMRLLERHPDAGLCFWYSLSLNHRTGALLENPIFLTKEPAHLSADEVAEAMDRIAIPGHAQDVPGNAAIWKRSEHLRTGAYRENLRWHADWFALQVVALRCGACFIPEPLALTRIDYESFSRSGRYDWPRQKIVLENILELLRSDEFRDVLPRFQKGKLLSQFAPWIVRVVTGQPRFWNCDNALLIENSLLKESGRFLHSPDPVVRQGTCVCLGHLGQSARRTRVPLALRSEDRDPAVRQAAVNAYAGIRGQQRSRLLPVDRLRGRLYRAGRRRLQKVWRVVRPIIARAYQIVNYRMYARIANVEKSLEALIRDHAGQLEELREEVRRLQAEKQTDSAGRNPPASGASMETAGSGCAAISVEISRKAA